MTAPLLDCYAITPPGIEGITATELRALGLIPGEMEPGGVAFQADRRGMYRANLQLRTANRILVRLASFHASSFAELERRTRRLDWSAVVNPDTPVRFRITSRKSRLYHQDAIAERLHRVLHSVYPSLEVTTGADEAGGSQLFVVRFWRDECTISADSSGALLHRRGYRAATAKAPLRETIAAAMLLAARYDGSGPLLDPLCGSGTICIEAALLAQRAPPGLRRGYGFERWPGFDAAGWEAIRRTAAAEVLPGPPQAVWGSDRDAGAIAAARSNAERAGVAEQIRLERCAFSAQEPPRGPGWLVTNPPYGVRIGDRQKLRNLYAGLGRFARERCRGWRAALLLAHPEHERQLALPLETVLTTNVGGIRVRLLAGLVS